MAGPPDSMLSTTPGQGHCCWPLFTRGESESYAEGAWPRVTELGSVRSGTRVSALTSMLACLGVGSGTAVSLGFPQKLQRREARETRPTSEEEAAAIGERGERNRDSQESRQPQLV